MTSLLVRNLPPKISLICRTLKKIKTWKRISAGTKKKSPVKKVGKKKGAPPGAVPLPDVAVKRSADYFAGVGFSSVCGRGELAVGSVAEVAALVLT